MLSRHNYSQSQGNLTSLIEKQLQDDFLVEEFLAKQQSGMSEAILTPSSTLQDFKKLFNFLLVKNKETKARQIPAINFQTIRLKTHGRQQSDMSTKPSQTFDSIYEKITKERDIEEQLEKEIKQGQKSLNLLKGDISHLIERGESTKTIANKISKIKIVAGDQLKKVNSAYIKDVQEEKIRSGMQHQFSQNLHHLHDSEITTLKRMKSNFVHSEAKKLELTDKLAKFDKTTFESPVQNRTDSKQAGFFAKWSIIGLKIRKLAKLVQDMKSLNSQDLASKKAQKIDYYDLNMASKKGKKTGSAPISLIIQVNLSELNRDTSFLLDQYSRNSQLLVQMEKINSSLEKRRAECYQILQDIQRTEKNHMDLLFNKKPVNREQVSTNNLKLQLKNRYRSNIGTMLQMILFMESEKSNSASLLAQAVSPLLNFDILSLPQQSEIREACQKFVTCFQKQVRKMLYTKRKGKTAKAEPIDSSNSKLSLRQSDSDENFEEQFIIEHRDKTPGSSRAQLTKSTSSQQLVPRAHRIMLLQKVDKQYAQMIKSTLQMEKENTRKNYEFQSTFKRTKYASRDKILEEKRFQARFSCVKLTRVPQDQCRKNSQAIDFQSLRRSSKRKARQSVTSPDANSQRD